MGGRKGGGRERDWVQCGAGTDSRRYHGNHIPPPPASLLTALPLDLARSASLLLSLLFKKIIVFLFVRTYTLLVALDLINHLPQRVQARRCKGSAQNRVCSPASSCTDGHILFSLRLVYFLLSIFTPPSRPPLLASVEQHASLMPPLVIAILPTHRAPFFPPHLTYGDFERVYQGGGEA